MVLEKLGSSLKNTLSKITKAIFVDEKLVNEIVKEIQKALLQSDVNVKLVLELTKEIKKRALKDDSPGLNKKEALIKIVYEELVKFLGEEKKELNIKEKPSKIMLVGLFGSGKCIHPDTNIAFSNGNIMTAKETFNKYEKKGTKVVEENETIINITNANLFVPSFNPETLKIEHKKLTHLWKLKEKKLLEVNLDNGNNHSVRVTPEHPFFTLRRGELQQIRADQLTEDDFVAVPNAYYIINQNKEIDLLPFLKNLDLNIKGLLTNIKDKSLKETCQNLKFKRNYCKFTSNIKKGILPIELAENFNNSQLNIKIKNSQKFINFPRYLTAELNEFLGFLLGNGHIENKYVELSNESPEVIERFSVLSNILFGIKPTIRKDIRTKNMYSIRIVSKTLIKLLDHIFLLKPGKKGKVLKIPELVLKSKDDNLKLFLRSYFDCDSYANKNSREIELVSESLPLIDQLNMVLMRFGIFSTKSKKQINNVSYGRLFIRARYAEIFAEKIGFIVSHKRKRVLNYKSIGLRQGCGKQDMIPLANKLLKLRNALGYSLGEIQDQVSSYGNYEKKGLISRESLAKVYEYYSKTTSGVIVDMIKSIKEENITNYSKCTINALIYHLKNEYLIKHSKNELKLTSKGNNLLLSIEKYDKLNALSFMNSLVNSNVCWLRVNQVKDCTNKEGHVYDFTVEQNHSFIADGIIVHNTTTTGKLAKYYKKRGKKVCVVGLDVWRPAAMKQLEQVAKGAQVDCFIDLKEKKPLKLWKNVEKDIKGYDIVIVDTAGRDALSKELIKEIEDITKAVQPQEKLLIISADIGQAAHKQAEQFHASCNITGVIITKMEGTAKGGGALTACSITKAPIKFIGVGEKVDDLEVFNPPGFVSRILGMGDIEALMDKAKEAIDEDEAQDLGKKLLKGEFNLIDLYEQMLAMKKMGPMSKVMEMIPGMSQIKMPKEALQVQEGKLKKWRFIMDSCTKEELEEPDKVITGERVERIAQGSGTSTHEVRELLKQYKQSKKLMKNMGGSEKKMQSMMKKLQGANIKL